MRNVRMTEVVAEAAGAALQACLADGEHLITIYRRPNGAWHAECIDHGWATGGPLRFVGETLGVHLQEEHPAERVEDFTDIFVTALYGLRGHSWDVGGRGIQEPTRENRA